MNKISLIEKVKEILNGIDEQQTESDQGWWETSKESDFGRNKLKDLIAAIELEINSNE